MFNYDLIWAVYCRCIHWDQTFCTCLWPLLNARFGRQKKMCLEISQLAVKYHLISHLLNKNDTNSKLHHIFMDLIEFFYVNSLLV